MKNAILGSKKNRFISILLFVCMIFQSCTQVLLTSPNDPYSQNSDSNYRGALEPIESYMQESIIWNGLDEDGNKNDIFAAEKASSFSRSALSGIGKILGGYVLNKCFDWCFDTLFSKSGEDSFDAEVIKQLDKIIEELQKVKERLEQIIRETKLSHYESIMLDKLVLFLNLATHTKETYEKLDELRKQYSGKKDEWVSHAKPIIAKWGTGTLNDAANSPEATINFAKLIMSPVARGRSYFQVYDDYSFNFFPWEHFGYSFREEMRAADIGLFVASSFLSLMYYDLTEDSIGRKMISDYATKLSKYVEKNKVIHHPEQRICQISGPLLGLKFKRELNTNRRPNSEGTCYPKYFSIPEWETLADKSNNPKKGIDEEFSVYEMIISFLEGGDLRHNPSQRNLPNPSEFLGKNLPKTYMAQGWVYKNLYQFYSKKGENLSLLEILRDKVELSFAGVTYDDNPIAWVPLLQSAPSLRVIYRDKFDSYSFKEQLKNFWYENTWVPLRPYYSTFAIGSRYDANLKEPPTWKDWSFEKFSLQYVLWTHWKFPNKSDGTVYKIAFLYDEPNPVVHVMNNQWYISLDYTELQDWNSQWY